MNSKNLDCFWLGKIHFNLLPTPRIIASTICNELLRGAILRGFPHTLSIHLDVRGNRGSQGRELANCLPAQESRAIAFNCAVRSSNCAQPPGGSELTLNVTGNKRRWKLLVIHILPPCAFSPQAGCCEKRAHHFIKVVLRRSKGKYRTPPQHHARTCVYIGGRVPLAARAVSKTDILRAPNTKSG